MNTRVVKFVKKACVKYGMEAYFIPSTGVYTLTRKGRAIQNFTYQQFCQIPLARRMWEYNALIKCGLNKNLGEGGIKNQVFIPRMQGIKIR